MYRSATKILSYASLGLATIIFALASVRLTAGLPFWGTVALAGSIYIIISLSSVSISRSISVALHTRAFIKGDTRILSGFVDRLRFCFTTNDLITALREIIESEADATVFLVDMPKRYAVYNSPTILGTDPSVFSELVRHYDSWRDGLFFFDENMDLVSDHRRSRGFFVVKDNLHLYCFMRFARFLEYDVFPELYGEFVSFLKRNETIEKMFSIAAISKEWSLVAETQRSFLPSSLPQIRSLELAAYFQPLVNVSGDYYDVLPIDEDRTLLVLGDVSGKGLAAALIMGIVVNTIRILEHKDDLELLVRSIDTAIKSMHLEDKYTVLFLGIVDTKRMTLSYVNASMADPLIISETGAGRQIRRLESNCSLIGIIDLESVPLAEIRLFPGDLILIASDGASEIPDTQGIMLGDTERWVDFITDESALPVQDFVDKLAAFVFDYAGEITLRDDVTMLAARIGASQ
ncbi:PP2C family protein-serine/threonine phosphatase [Treponema sp.]